MDMIIDNYGDELAPQSPNGFVKYIGSGIRQDGVNFQDPEEMETPEDLHEQTLSEDLETECDDDQIRGVSVQQTEAASDMVLSPIERKSIRSDGTGDDDIEPLWLKSLRIRLPNEVWLMIGDYIVDPAERFQLCKSLPFIQPLYRRPVTQWGMPLLIRRLLKYLPAEDISSTRIVCKAWRASVDDCYQENQTVQIPDSFKLIIDAHHFLSKEITTDTIVRRGFEDIANNCCFFSRYLVIDLTGILHPTHDRSWIENLPSIFEALVIRNQTRVVSVQIGIGEWNSLQMYWILGMLLSRLKHVTRITTEGVLASMNDDLNDAVMLEIVANPLPPLAYNRPLFIKIGEAGEVHPAVNAELIRAYHSDLQFGTINFITCDQQTLNRFGQDGYFSSLRTLEIHGINVYNIGRLFHFQKHTRLDEIILCGRSAVDLRTFIAIMTGFQTPPEKIKLHIRILHSLATADMWDVLNPRIKQIFLFDHWIKRQREYSKPLDIEAMLID